MNLVLQCNHLLRGHAVARHLQAEVNPDIPIRAPRPFRKSRNLTKPGFRAGPDCLEASQAACRSTRFLLVCSKLSISFGVITFPFSRNSNEFKTDACLKFQPKFEQRRDRDWSWVLPPAFQSARFQLRTVYWLELFAMAPQRFGLGDQCRITHKKPLAPWLAVSGGGIMDRCYIRRGQPIGLSLSTRYRAW